VEEGGAVRESDRSDEVEYLPVTCFPELPREGTRVVDGHIDWRETNRVRAEIRGILERMDTVK